MRLNILYIIHYLGFSYNSLLFILLVGFLLVGCKDEGSKLNKTELFKSPHTTDSLVVAQLIQRSEEFLKENPDAPEVYDGFLREAFDISVRSNLVTQEIIILNIVGKRCRNRAQYGEALKFYYKALDLAQKINNVALLAEIYNQLGVVYRRTDDNAMALDLH